MLGFYYCACARKEDCSQGVPRKSLGRVLVCRITTLTFASWPPNSSSFCLRGVSMSSSLAACGRRGGAGGGVQGAARTGVWRAGTGPSSVSLCGEAVPAQWPGVCKWWAGRRGARTQPLCTFTAASRSLPHLDVALDLADFGRHADGGDEAGAGAAGDGAAREQHALLALRARVGEGLHV